MPEFSYTYTRDNLASLLDDVESTREPVIIKRRGHRDAVVIDGDELRSLEETAHLLRSPANARRLLEALLEVNGDAGRRLTLEQLRSRFAVG
ncbi:MAG: type II toxin-antitoxin system Phd/YefM family antitoxin [Longimicrobiales bacterium]